IDGDDGQVTVALTSTSSILADGSGIYSSTDTGGITINTAGTIGLGNAVGGLAGIQTSSLTGLQDINVLDGGTVNAVNIGISATSGSLIFGGNSNIDIDV